MLSRTDELLLQPRTPEVMNEIIELNIGLAHKQLARFKMSFDNEGISYAYEGLFLAVRGFDTSQNIKFSTYATCCIYNKLCEYIRIKSKAPLTLYEEKDVHDDQQDLSYISTMEVIKAVVSSYKGPRRLIIETWIKLGYHQLATSKATGYSQSHVNKIVNDFRSVLKEQIKN